jgi:ABC-type antimicrobial peptide transport system permease subunit
MAYFVSQRRQELGIRLALGASARQVLALVFNEASRLVFVGCGIGLVIALAIAQLLRAMLFRVQPIDAWTFAAALLLLPAVAMCTTCFSAWRATRIDPVKSLRNGQ